jgi:hypothetical protein
MSLNWKQWFHERHRFRFMMCSHKAVEAAAVCTILMVQGDIAGITLTHLAVASKTGLLAMSPLLGVTLTRHARHLTNRWLCSALLAVSAFLADTLIHESHYPGAYTEAAMTAAGAFLFSVAISYTPVGKYIDRLAESFHHRSDPA